MARQWHATQLGLKLSVKRLSNWNYHKASIYFITFNTELKLPTLGYYKKNSVKLSKFGVMTKDVIIKQSQKYEEFSIDVFNILPEHVHLIVTIEGSSRNSLSEFIRHIKSISSRLYNIEMCLTGTKNWKRRFHERVIKDDFAYQNIYRYVKYNHLKHIKNLNKYRW